MVYPLEHCCCITEIRIIDILLTADISNIKTIVIDKVIQDVGMSDVSTLLIPVVYEAFVHMVAVRFNPLLCVYDSLLRIRQ